MLRQLPPERSSGQCSSSSTSVALGPGDFNERDTIHFSRLRHAAAKSCSSAPQSTRSSSQ